MHKWFLTAASLIGALSVALGAFAAHGLRQAVSAETLAMFETGVRYQFYHAFALLAVGILYEKYGGSQLRWAGNFFQLGIVFFSGSLYLMTALKAKDLAISPAVGIITPFG